MKKFNAENVYGIGDTHSLAFDRILEHYELKNFILIHVGDCGMGFQHPTRDLSELQILDDYCKKNNGRIFMIRGNHDRPECWDNTFFSDQLERVHLVKDYTRYMINGKEFLFAGGATSIDRYANILNVDYFNGEEFNLPKDYEKLAPCDVLVTHTRGSHQPPYEGNGRIKHWFVNDPLLEEELEVEQDKLEKLYYQVTPKILHVWGHMHYPQDMVVNETRWRCLDINEVWDITKVLDAN